MRAFRHWLLGFCSLLASTSFCSQPRAGELKLALANSTCDAMKKVCALYRTREAVQFSYVCKSSGLLAKGLQGGALDADIFVSADREWMDFAIDNGLVDRDRVTSPWGNVLVVATPRGGSIRRLDWEDLASDKVTAILIGDPSTAPFGRYAKEALEASALWDRVKGKIQTRKNIEILADSLAQASPTTVGIMFRSNVTEQLRTLHVVDKDLHKPIRYYMAPLKSSAGNAHVADFLKFMQGHAVREVFQAEGFLVGAP